MKRYIVHLNIPAYVIVEVQAEDEDEAIVQAEKFNLPPRRDGVYYIVSRQVAEAAPDRDDLIFPDQIVYGPGGEKLGCQAFAQKGEQ